ncbi:Putative tRNA pseudouridine synthase Pus10 [Sarcoptes scabiei]|nr:Putative tRNA pseudouridine synthase Pus10 [Sarcoptes scabiei]
MMDYRNPTLKSDHPIVDDDLEKKIQSYFNEKFPNRTICSVCRSRFQNNHRLFSLKNLKQLTRYSQDASVSNCSDIHLTNPSDGEISSLQNTAICCCCLNLLEENFIAAKVKQIVETVHNQAVFKDFRLQISLPFILTLRNLYFARLFKIDYEETIHCKDVLKTFLNARLEQATTASHNIDSDNIIDFDHQSCSDEYELLRKIHKESLNRKQFKSMPTTRINHTSLIKIFEEITDEQLDRFDLIELNTECKLNVSIKREPLYIAGRYLKLSRNVSQTPWSVASVAPTSSVQERLCDGINRYIKTDRIKFSASGREDVDVRMLGRGRPFLIEISDPPCLIPDDCSRKIQQHINENFDDVKVRDLQFVSKNQSQILLKQGEQEKTKSYQALCCIDRPFTDQDSNVLNSITNLEINQKTPIRVLHRRTLIDRKKTIFEIKVMPIDFEEIEAIKNLSLQSFSERIFKIFIKTEAGTYIKEFVHSDNHRTEPSIGKF